MSRTSHSRHQGRGRPAASMSRTSCPLASRATSTNATRAPCSAKAVTMAAPIPLPPPVTNTTRPRRLGNTDRAPDGEAAAPEEGTGEI